MTKLLYSLCSVWKSFSLIVLLLVAAHHVLAWKTNNTQPPEETCPPLPPGLPRGGCAQLWHPRWPASVLTLIVSCSKRMRKKSISNYQLLSSPPAPKQQQSSTAHTYLLLAVKAERFLVLLGNMKCTKFGYHQAPVAAQGQTHHAVVNNWPQVKNWKHSHLLCSHRTWRVKSAELGST